MAAWPPSAARSDAFVDACLKEIETRGPISAGEFENGGRSQGSWWGWSDGKRALEWLFWAGT